MAISFVDAGAVEAGIGTSSTIPTPAGSTGDLCIWQIVHDDYSDGLLAALSPPITVNTIHDGSPQLGDDNRGCAYWTEETQDAARNFDFGTLANSEEIRGVCLRFRGHVAGAPILSGSIQRRAGSACPALTATKIGQMIVHMVFSDLVQIGDTAAAGWVERVDSQVNASAIYCQTKLVADVDDMIVPEPAEPGGGTSTSSPGLYSLGFIIDSPTTAYTLAGVTKDKDGDALGSCTVVLLKDAGTNDWKQVTTQTSNATTGAYSFTVYDNDAKYMVIAYKGDTPHVFDVTDYVLQPSA